MAGLSWIKPSITAFLEAGEIYSYPRKILCPFYEALRYILNTFSLYAEHVASLNATIEKLRVISSGSLSLFLRDFRIAPLQICLRVSGRGDGRSHVVREARPLACYHAIAVRSNVLMRMSCAGDSCLLLLETPKTALLICIPINLFDMKAVTYCDGRS